MGGAHLVNPMIYNSIYGSGGNGGGGGYPQYPQTRSRDGSIGAGAGAGGRGPRMSASSHTSRTGTPDFDRIMGMGGGGGMGMNPQVPTRSLWIGNLDVDATSDTLLMVFAQYGPIESVRMLPEKVSYISMTVCGRLQS
jgi:protein JSN1